MVLSTRWDEAQRTRACAGSLCQAQILQNVCLKLCPWAQRSLRASCLHCCGKGTDRNLRNTGDVQTKAIYVSGGVQAKAISSHPCNIKLGNVGMAA